MFDLNLEYDSIAIHCKKSYNFILVWSWLCVMTKDILQGNITSWDLVIVYSTKDFVSSSGGKANKVILLYGGI